MAAPQMIAAVAFGWLGYAFLRWRRHKGPDEVPQGALALDGELYPWRPAEVDAVLDEALAVGERDLERLALDVARQVYPATPEGLRQPWPPHEDDARAECLLDRIRIRANRRLAELADDEAGKGPEGSDPNRPRPNQPTTMQAPSGPRQPTRSARVLPARTAQTVESSTKHRQAAFVGSPDVGSPEVDTWPHYPEPGPVDLTKWTDPSNYPTPGHFHQVGGPHSGPTLQEIAIKALVAAFNIVHGDLELAKELAQREENWTAYRNAINCCPWNHALYGSSNPPGTPYHYETPHGDQISLFAVHDDVVWKLVGGETPERRVSEHDPRVPAGGRHAFLWLPPLDPEALRLGRVKVEHAKWWTGDFTMMPPPEVLALGLADVPPGRVWGCGGFQAAFRCGGGA